MKKYLALLRGINVNGKNIIKMDDLKSLFQSIGLSSIRTYLQSGNIIFQYLDSDKKTIEKLIHEAIFSQWGMSIPVFVYDSIDWQGIVANNPFTVDESKDSSFFHCTLFQPLLDINLEPLTWDRKKADNEAWEISHHVIYLYCPQGYGQTKLNNNFFEKQMKTDATTRNWKTMLALQELIK